MCLLVKTLRRSGDFKTSAFRVHEDNTTAAPTTIKRPHGIRETPQKTGACSIPSPPELRSEVDFECSATPGALDTNRRIVFGYISRKRERRGVGGEHEKKKTTVRNYRHTWGSA